jgi:hypothetical protein
MKMAPTINANGTHSDVLCKTYGAATDAVRDAIRMVCDIAPHPRDYPTNKDWSVANLAHARIVVALAKIRDELEESEVQILDQVLDQKKFTPA